MSVYLETSAGDVVVDLYTDECPLASKNFLKLCKCASNCFFFAGCCCPACSRDVVWLSYNVQTMCTATAMQQSQLAGGIVAVHDACAVEHAIHMWLARHQRTASKRAPGSTAHLLCRVAVHTSR